MSTGDSTITCDYNKLVSFAGYDSKTDYSAGFWQATHDSSNTLYQDLVSAGHSIGADSVPEPGSIVLGTVGFLFVVGQRLRRRVA